MVLAIIRTSGSRVIRSRPGFAFDWFVISKDRAKKMHSGIFGVSRGSILTNQFNSLIFASIIIALKIFVFHHSSWCFKECGAGTVIRWFSLPKWLQYIETDN